MLLLISWELPIKGICVCDYYEPNALRPRDLTMNGTCQETPSTCRSTLLC